MARSGVAAVHDAAVAPSPCPHPPRRPGRRPAGGGCPAGLGPGQPGHARPRAEVASAQQPAQQRLAAISARVSALIRKMTLAEKLGQLEMSGPTGSNGAPGQTLLTEV